MTDTASFRQQPVTFVVAARPGLDLCSEIKLGLLRRLAATTVQAEALEADVMNGKSVDIGTLCTLASTVMRLSMRLGLGDFVVGRCQHCRE